MFDKRLIAMAAVVIILLAAVGYLAVPADKPAGATFATIYVKDTESNDVWSAEIDLSKPSNSEAAMMAIGGNIRETTLMPLAGYDSQIGGIAKTRHYEVSVKVDGNIILKDIKTVTKGEAGFSGTCMGMLDLLTTTSITTKSTVLTIPGLTNYAPPGDQIKFYSISMREDGGKWFDQYMTSSLATSGTPLTGLQLNGMKLNVWVKAYATDLDNTAVNSNVANAYLTINVTDWVSGSMVVAIDGLTGTQTLS